MIRLRFSTGDGIAAAGIRGVSFGFWATHVDSITSDGRLLGAHYFGGVQLRAADYDAADTTESLIVDLPCAGDVAQSFTTFVIDQLGRPYDVNAIGAFVLHRDWQMPGAWFCSELIAAALVHSGYLRPLVAEANRITPRDLLLILSAFVPVGPVVVHRPRRPV